MFLARRLGKQRSFVINEVVDAAAKILTKELDDGVFHLQAPIS